MASRENAGLSPPQGTAGAESSSHPRIERRSIDYVNAKERHGNVRGQIPIWFMGQFQLVTLSLGFIGPSMGLSFQWCVLAGALGTVFGTIFMALHATQGPIMGLPQMIQSRAQFGYRGVIIPLIAVLIDFVGYNVVCSIIMATGLQALFGIEAGPVVLVGAALSGVLAIYGHDWVHRLAKWLFWINLPVFGLLTLAIARGAISGGNAAAGAAAGFTLVAFGTQFAAAASNAIAYAPFVSDYSRYLKRGTPALSIIGAVFAGSTISGFWMIGLGAWLASHIAAADPVTAIYVAGNGIDHRFGTAMALIAVSMNLIVLTMNTYSSSLGVLTIINSLRPTRPTSWVRIAVVIGVTIAWALLALAGGEDVVNAAWLALTIMLYVLVPWTAVNLVDFFFIRHGRYAVTELFKPRGIYGEWNWRGLLPYAAGLVAMAPFAVLPKFYTGPLAQRLGGIDIAWFIGLIVAAGLYQLVAPRAGIEAAAIAGSERELEPGANAC